MWSFNWFNKLWNIKKQETALTHDGSSVDETVFTGQIQSEVSSQVDDLTSYLYNDMENPDIINQSRNNLDTLNDIYDRKKMVTFIGAGTSKPLGISDWGNLMDSLHDEAQKKGFSGGHSNDSNKWPQEAQDIYEYLENNGNENIYFNTITKKMMPKNNSTTLTLIKLVLAFDIHLTTNFDNSIEYAYKFYDYLSSHFGKNELRKEYKLHYLPDFDLYSEEMELGLIYYLHGNIEKEEYILKKEEYETFYPSISSSGNGVKHLESFLRGQYVNNSIIFLGFSFDDHYVKEYFFKLAKEIEKEEKIVSSLYDRNEQSNRTKQIKHFLLISDKVLKDHGSKIHDTFQEYNIYPIIYKEGDYIFIEKLCEALSKRKYL